MHKNILIKYIDDQAMRNSEDLGIRTENLQGKLIFKPEPFVEGTCRMYIEGRGSILMEKEEDCYTIDILSSLLVNESLDVCFKITEPENEKGIPIFCSKIIHFKVYDTIDTEGEVPEQYPSWEQVLDSMIAEVEELEEDVEEAIGNIQDLTEAYNQNATEKTNAFNQNATQKTNDFNANYTQKVNDFDTATDTILATKEGQLDTYEQIKEVELNAYTGTKKAELDSYETTKETEINNYVTTKKTEIDTYTGTKKTELDTYEGAKETELNTYASGLKDTFDDNATSKTNAFNTNATEKTTAFDNNATAKTTTFDENATSKTGEFNSNATEKTTEFDSHVSEKEAEFDENVDDIEQEITDIQEFIESELDKVTTEKSTRIDITGAAKWYGDLPIFPRTEQKQLSGKNKLNIKDYMNSSSNGLNYIYNSDGSFSVSGTATSGWSAVRNSTNEVLEAGTYTFSIDKVLTHRIYIGFTYEDDSTQNIIIPAGETKKTFTATQQIKKYSLILSDIITGTEYDETIFAQLEPGSVASSFEQYCGGQASPNPDFPQPIENVEGNNEINVCNKNCLDVNGLTIINRGLEWTGNSDGSIVVNGEASSSSSYGFQMTPKLKIGTYVLSIRESVLYKLKMRLHKKVSNTFIYATIQIGDTLSSSFNIDEEIDYCQFYMDSGISSGDAINFTFYPQLEEGTTATQYEEHKEQTYNLNLGDIELCKIGDYEDYFYKENNKWYLYKATGKSVIDENTRFTYSQQTNNIFYSFSAANGVAITNNVPFCTHYKGENNVHNAGQACAKGNNSIMFKDYDSVTYIVDNRFTTVADLKEWLATNNVTIYYALATPVVTEITDTTMIEQLEALEHLMLYKDANHIWTETDGLEPNLQLTYYKSNKLRLDNIEARLELLEE